jgi:hypothetical protein
MGRSGVTSVVKVSEVESGEVLNWKKWSDDKGSEGEWSGVGWSFKWEEVTGVVKVSKGELGDV